MSTQNTSPPTTPTATSSDLRQYTKRVTNILKQITDIKNGLITEEYNSLDNVDIAVGIDYLENLYHKMEQALSWLEEKCENRTNSSAFSNFMTLYFEIKTKIKYKFIIDCNSRSMPYSSTVPQFSLDETSSARNISLLELKML